MSDATLSSTTAEPEWAAFVAIDWADQKHFWRLACADSGQQEQGELENTPEAVDTWAAGLSVRFGGRPIALCLEQSRGALVYMLAKYPHLVLFPVHPRTAAQYRETFCPSGAKSDPNDTASLLDLLQRHRERLRQLQPDTSQTRLLQLLVETRRCAVNEKTRQKNRLTDCLKRYFPQVLQWFDEVDSPLVAALLQRWPDLTELKRAHPGTLRKFFHQHNCRVEERIRERIAGIQTAVPATVDAAILEGEAFHARGLVAVMAALRVHIDELDQRIAQLVAEHPEGSLFASLPGTGPVLVPRLIVAFGTRRERYESAYEMQCYSGIAPVTEASGKSQWVHFRRACPRFLRQTFHEFAFHSIPRSPWARAFYDSQIAKQKSHHAAVRALAHRWIRIIFRCWKDGKPYDEQAYQRSLQRRGSPLIGSFAPATGVGWKTEAGFQKFSQENS
jgi:transposase